MIRIEIKERLLKYKMREWVGIKMKGYIYTFCILWITFASSILFFCIYEVHFMSNLRFKCLMFFSKEILSFLSVLMLNVAITISSFCWIYTHRAIHLLGTFWSTLMKTILRGEILEQGNTSLEKIVVEVYFILNWTYLVAKNCSQKVPV